MRFVLAQVGDDIAGLTEEFFAVRGGDPEDWCGGSPAPLKKVLLCLRLLIQLDETERDVQHFGGSTDSMAEAAVAVVIESQSDGYTAGQERRDPIQFVSKRLDTW